VSNNNGKNDYGVSYSIISWLETALRTHGNIAGVRRYDDIVFDVIRQNQNDHLEIFCAAEYACGITFVQKVLSEYPNCNCISVGGRWNGYTSQAKEFCLSRQMGLFVSDELMGALWLDEYWKYIKREPTGEPVFFYR
jgi:hypothetical protein